MVERNAQRLRHFVWQTGFDDGKWRRPPTTGWHPEDQAAYDSGYAHGEEQADVVGGVLGHYVIREHPETGERRVEYFHRKERV